MSIRSRNLSAMLDVGGGVMPLAGFWRDALGGAGERRLSRLPAPAAGAAAANGRMRRSRPRRGRPSTRRCSRRSQASPLVDLAPVVATPGDDRSFAFELLDAKQRALAPWRSTTGTAPRREAIEHRRASRGHRGLLRRARFHALMARRRRIGASPRAPPRVGCAKRARTVSTYPLTKSQPWRRARLVSWTNSRSAEAVAAYVAQASGARDRSAAHFALDWRAPRLARHGRSADPRGGGGRRRGRNSARLSIRRITATSSCASEADRVAFAAARRATSTSWRRRATPCP